MEFVDLLEAIIKNLALETYLSSMRLFLASRLEVFFRKMAYVNQVIIGKFGGKCSWCSC